MATRSRKRNKVLTLTIDLARVFNRIGVDREPSVRRQLRDQLTSVELQKQFGLKVIELIKRKTRASIDYRNKPFKKYAQSYIDSAVFKLYGKKPNVNLTLTGEMLTSMVSKSTGATSLKISFIGKKVNDRAHGHTFGIRSKKYGKVIRDFFNITEEEENSILKELLQDRAVEEDEDLLAEHFLLELQTKGVV